MHEATYESWHRGRRVVVRARVSWLHARGALGGNGRQRVDGASDTAHADERGRPATGEGRVQAGHDGESGWRCWTGLVVVGERFVPQRDPRGHQILPGAALDRFIRPMVS